MSDEPITIGHKQYLVESLSFPGTHYAVSWEPDERGVESYGCTCDGFGFRGDCRHVRIVQLWELAHPSEASSQAGLSSFGQETA